MKTGKVALSATALLLIFGRYAFSMSCNATSPSTQDCAVGLTWQDNSSGSNQEDCVDIYFSAGPTAFSKVGTVASDVVSFVHNVAGVAAGVQLCYQVQAGNNAGLSLLQHRLRDDSGDSLRNSPERAGESSGAIRGGYVVVIEPFKATGSNDINVNYLIFRQKSCQSHYLIY